MSKANKLKAAIRARHSGRNIKIPLFSPEVAILAKWLVKYAIFIGLLPFFIYLLRNGIYPAGMSIGDGIALAFAAMLFGFYLVILIYISTVWGWFVTIPIRYSAKALNFIKLKINIPEKTSRAIILIIFVTGACVFTYTTSQEFLNEYAKPIASFTLGAIAWYYSFEIVKKSMDERNKSIGLELVFLFVFGLALILSSSAKHFILNPTDKMAASMGISASNVNIMLSKESDFNKIYEKDGKLNGCKKENGFLLSGVDLIWNGIGNVSYVKIERENSQIGKSNRPSRIISIPNSQIQSIEYAPKYGEYCMEFDGDFFKKGTKTPSDNFNKINLFAHGISLQFDPRFISKAIVEWSADPIEVGGKLSNYQISKERAVVVENTLKSYFCRDIKSPICQVPSEIESIGMGASDVFANCKDWPNPKTKNECLAKNRGGKITVYVKNS